MYFYIFHIYYIISQNCGKVNKKQPKRHAAFREFSVNGLRILPPLRGFAARRGIGDNVS
jgi:hypothetical protein